MHAPYIACCGSCGCHPSTASGSWLLVTAAELSHGESHTMGVNARLSALWLQPALACMPALPQEHGRNETLVISPCMRISAPCALPASPQACPVAHPASGSDGMARRRGVALTSGRRARSAAGPGAGGHVPAEPWAAGGRVGRPAGRPRALGAGRPGRSGRARGGPAGLHRAVRLDHEREPVGAAADQCVFAAGARRAGRGARHGTAQLHGVVGTSAGGLCAAGRCWCCPVRQCCPKTKR